MSPSDDLNRDGSSGEQAIAAADAAVEALHALTTNCGRARLDPDAPAGRRAPARRLAFYAAREPEVAAELVVSLRLIGALFAAVSETESLDIAVLLTAAPANQLVSSECAVSGGLFGDPAGYLPNPVEDVPTHHLDSGRFALADVRADYPAAEELLGLGSSGSAETTCSARFRNRRARSAPRQEAGLDSSPST
jgi:hypothetical protein